MSQYDKVLQVANILRNNINKVYKGDLAGECGNASSILVRILKHFNVKSVFYSGSYYRPKSTNRWGEGHCWMRYKDTIIDITATQFGQTDRVFVQPHTSELYRGSKSRDHSDYLLSSSDMVYHKIYHETIKEIQELGIFSEYHKFPNGDVRKIYRAGNKPPCGTYATIGPRYGQLRGKDQKIVSISNKKNDVLPAPNHPTHKYVRIILKDA